MKEIVMIMLSIGVMSSAALADTVNFDNFKVGAPPSGWTATSRTAANRNSANGFDHIPWSPVAIRIAAST